MNDSISIDFIGSDSIIRVEKPLQKEDIPDRVFFIFKTEEDYVNAEVIQYMTLAAARQSLREKGELL